MVVPTVMLLEALAWVYQIPGFIFYNILYYNRYAIIFL